MRVEMQVKQAAVLRTNWEGKPCEHPKLVVEYNQTQLTGDLVCIQCGATFPHEDAASFRRQERGVTSETEKPQVRE
jgi:transcription elongation factor Elf1